MFSNLLLIIPVSTLQPVSVSQPSAFLIIPLFLSEICFTITKQWRVKDIYETDSERSIYHGMLRDIFAVHPQSQKGDTILGLN